VDISLLDSRPHAATAANYAATATSTARTPPLLLKDWELWSRADGSHLSYPVLAYFRSQHDNQSWIASLTAILDTCRSSSLVSKALAKTGRAYFCDCTSCVVTFASLCTAPSRAARPFARAGVAPHPRRSRAAPRNSMTEKKPTARSPRFAKCMSLYLCACKYLNQTCHPGFRRKRQGQLADTRGAVRRLIDKEAARLLPMTISKTPVQLLYLQM